jgi:hypothetical protein
MKCMDYLLKYVGQTDRKIYPTCKEHIQAIRNNNGNPGYSIHILSTGYTYGSTTDTMNVIKKGKKGENLNTLEKYHI